MGTGADAPLDMDETSSGSVPREADAIDLAAPLLQVKMPDECDQHDEYLIL